MLRITCITMAVLSGWFTVSGIQMAAGDDVPSSASTLKSGEKNPKETPAEEFKLPPGLVYFVGSVERTVGESAVVDLGDVHSLRKGAIVTLFRSADNQFRPLGTVVVAESHPTWMQTTGGKGFTPQVGDLVIFIRTVGELGTGPAIQDRFLSWQRIANRNRNGYSTVRLYDASNALMKIRLEQPKWVQFEKRIAGTILGETMQNKISVGLQGLLNQINLFRRLKEEGFPVAEAAGAEWNTVMRQLQGPPPGRDIVLTKAGPASQPEDAAGKTETFPILEIQNMVFQVLFDRSEEEQAIASALSFAMLHGITRNEPNWLRLQLQQTQFARLAQDEQFQIDIARVLRQLREKHQQ
jgi:hypothetical protein